MPSPPDASLDFTPDEMDHIWDEVARLATSYRHDLPHLRVAPILDPEKLRSSIHEIDFDDPKPWGDVLAWVDRHLRDHQVHLGHTRYFGLFNPAPVPLGIAADALTAAYNPQLAAWSHSPFANELEAYLIQQFGMRFGYPDNSIDGTFCSGGAEANYTALLCAITSRFPEYETAGVRALPGQPALYISKYAHHSWIKAAKACGLGTAAVRTVPCDESYRLDTAQLKRTLDTDRNSGFYPVLICGTAGNTGPGAIDPLRDLASVARDSACWYHVDAAWGGGACFVPEYRAWLSGVEEADSITFDAHKFLSIPMGAGVFLTRHKDILTDTFRIATDYMPRDAATLDVTDPYTHSMQWSRRFIGLKVFLPLASAGWSALANTIRRQCHLGSQLKHMLLAEGWECLNETPLPLVCFSPPGIHESAPIQRIADFVVQSGLAWISTVELDRPALRACITNFRTTENDLTDLVRILNQARSHELSKEPARPLFTRQHQKQKSKPDQHPH